MFPTLKVRGIWSAQVFTKSKSKYTDRCLWRQVAKGALPAGRLVELSFLDSLANKNTPGGGLWANENASHVPGGGLSANQNAPGGDKREAGLAAVALSLQARGLITTLMINYSIT
jgi:hypothetical protein